VKEIVAKELAARVRDGEVIGVGTGSTVDLALDEIATRVRQEGLRLTVVPTSLQSAWKCQEAGLQVSYSGYCGELSWGFDGADAIDDRLRAIKGKGGAMLQEKILAARCLHYVLIVDDSKMVAKLGPSCPVPVEVIPEARFVAEQQLKVLGAASVTLRKAVAKHGPVISEGGNIIIDAVFNEISDSLEHDIKCIVGVVESGLFTRFASEVLIGSASGVKILKRTA
jgi:ribose 5-phosphate isomerase A